MREAYIMHRLGGITGNSKQHGHTLRWDDSRLLASTCPDFEAIVLQRRMRCIECKSGEHVVLEHADVPFWPSGLDWRVHATACQAWEGYSLGIRQGGRLLHSPRMGRSRPPGYRSTLGSSCLFGVYMCVTCSVRDCNVVRLGGGSRTPSATSNLSVPLKIGARGKA